MKGVLGLGLVGGGVFLLVSLFNGTLKFPIGGVNMGNSSNPFSGILGSTPPQTSSPNTPGYVPPINNTCKNGYVLDTKTGQCIPRA